MIVQDAHFTWTDDMAQHDPFMVCDVCGNDLCTIEEGDSLTTIISVYEDHRDACPGDVG